MASITIRNLEQELKSRLRIRAAHRGRSMEEEVREILRSALASEGAGSQNLAASIRTRFRALGGTELDIPSREPLREPPEFEP